GLVEKAVTELEAALQAGGGDLKDYIDICNYMRFSKAPDKFFQFTLRAAQLFPGEPHVLFFHAVALNQMKRYADAADLMQRTAKLAEAKSPDLLNHSFYFQHGVALERSGHIDEAAKKFERSIDLTPTDNLEIAAQSMNYLGYMWLEKGEHLDRAE